VHPCLLPTVSFTLGRSDDTAMEDSHAIVLDLDETKNAFFAVYDGHGGAFQSVHSIVPDLTPPSQAGQ
jgi:serine/threonine protein phosphatase PrpC